MPGAQRDSAFLNIPYDPSYEGHFVAYIAGVSAFGLDPRATLELTAGTRRLDRIFDLIAACKYSFHDVSCVILDKAPPETPRFNMPFELGLVIGLEKSAPSGHEWFVFESSRHRIKKSLSDLDGTDPFIYKPAPEGILREIRNALSRHSMRPTAQDMQNIFGVLTQEVPRILKNAGAFTVFEARPFADLVVLARRLALEIMPGLPGDS
jgi:hypothetical protein